MMIHKWQLLVQINIKDNKLFSAPLKIACWTVDKENNVYSYGYFCLGL
jgi:hypothetical protein